MVTRKMQQILSWIGRAIVIMAVALLSVFPAVSFETSDIAYAAIYVGDDKIEGYEPQDIISTDEVMPSEPDKVVDKLEDIEVRLIKRVVPILMIICVGIIVFNAVRNIIKPKEERVAMGELIKNMFVQFFYILFAFIIVEFLVFIVTGGEKLFLEIIYGG